MSTPGAGPVTDQEYQSIISYINSLRLADLKLVARALSIAQAGRKADVSDRIKRYLQIGKESQDAVRVRAIGTIVGHAFRQEPIPNYEEVYRGFEMTMPRSQSSLSQSGYSQDSLPRTQTNPRKPWLFFKENPFFTLKKLVTPNAGLCLKAPNARGTGQVSFQLSEQDTELLNQSSKYKLFLLCGAYDKNKPSTDALIEFPQPLEIHFNGVPIKDNVKGLKNKPGTARPANLTPHVAPARHNNTLNMVYAFTKSDYLIFCYLIEEVSPEKILQKILSNPHIVKEKTLHDFQNEGDDDDIQEVSTRLSLKCPLSFTRFKYPAKSIACKHVPCFDALSFIYLQEQASTWTCPVCSIPVKVKDIAIDDYVLDIMKNTSDEVETVEIDLDGTWKPIYEEGDGKPQPSASPVANVKQESLSAFASRNHTPGASDSPIVISLDSDEEDEEVAPQAPQVQQPLQATKPQQAPQAPQAPQIPPISTSSLSGGNSNSNQQHSAQQQPQQQQQQKQQTQQSPQQQQQQVQQSQGAHPHQDQPQHQQREIQQQQQSHAPQHRSQAQSQSHASPYLHINAAEDQRTTQASPGSNPAPHIQAQSYAARTLPQPPSNIQAQNLPSSVQPSPQQQQFDILSRSLPQHQAPALPRISPPSQENQIQSPDTTNNVNEQSANPQVQRVEQHSSQAHRSPVRKPPPQSPPVQNNGALMNNNAPQSSLEQQTSPPPHSIAQVSSESSNMTDQHSNNQGSASSNRAIQNAHRSPVQPGSSIPSQAPSHEPSKPMSAYEREMLELNQLKQRIYQAGKGPGRRASPSLPPAVPAHQRFDRLSTSSQAPKFPSSSSAHQMSNHQMNNHQINNHQRHTSQHYENPVYRLGAHVPAQDHLQNRQPMYGNFPAQTPPQQYYNNRVQNNNHIRLPGLAQTSQNAQDDRNQELQRQSQLLKEAEQALMSQDLQRTKADNQNNHMQASPSSNQQYQSSISNQRPLVAAQNYPQLPSGVHQTSDSQNVNQQRRVASNPDSALTQTAQQSSLKASLDNYQQKHGLNRANTINIPQTRGHPVALQNVQRLKENLKNRSNQGSSASATMARENEAPTRTSESLFPPVPVPVAQERKQDQPLMGKAIEPPAKSADSMFSSAKPHDQLGNGQTHQLSTGGSQVQPQASLPPQQPEQSQHQHQSSTQQNQEIQPSLPQSERHTTNNTEGPRLPSSNMDKNASPSLSSVSIPSWSKNNLLRSTSTTFSPSRFGPPQGSSTNSSNPSNQSSPQMASASPNSTGNPPEHPTSTTGGILGINVDTNRLFKKADDKNQSSQMQKSRSSPNIFIPTKRPISSDKRKISNQSAPDNIKRPQTQPPADPPSSNSSPLSTLSSSTPQPTQSIVPGPALNPPSTSTQPSSLRPQLPNANNSAVINLTSDDDDDIPLLQRKDRPASNSFN